MALIEQFMPNAQITISRVLGVQQIVSDIDTSLGEYSKRRRI